MLRDHPKHNTVLEGAQHPVSIRHVAQKRLVRSGLIVACPHSGRHYPNDLKAASRLDAFSLRRSEDAFVDQLFETAPDVGGDLLVNEFARAYVDVNRSDAELDSELIHGLEAHDGVIRSQRVEAGLGVIPRTVGDGMAIYYAKLSHEEALSRLNLVHRPWHETIERLMAEAVATNGQAILLDCHSMPTSASTKECWDVVLGDRFGESCAPIIAQTALAFLQASGLKVTRNDPFAGGYSTTRHGRPFEKRHALQIEINRSLYMVEGTFELRPAFHQIKSMMAGLVTALADVCGQMRASRALS